MKNRGGITIFALLLALYSAFLIRIMIFREIPVIKIGHLMFKFGGADANGEANFVPFKTIVPYLFGFKGLIIAGVNLAGNIGLLIPVGFLLPYVFRKISWQQVLMLSIATGLFIEGMQVILRTGIFDIDDVILNGLGVMAGYWLSIGLKRLLKNKGYEPMGRI